MATAKRKGVSSVDKQELASRLFVRLFVSGGGRTPEHYAQQAFDGAGVFLQTYEASQAAEREAEEAEAAVMAESPPADTPESTDTPADDSQTFS